MHTDYNAYSLNEITNIKSTINLNWNVFSEYIISNQHSSSSSSPSSTQIDSLLSCCKQLIDENIQTAKCIRNIKDKMSTQNNKVEVLPERLINEYKEEKKKNLQLQNIISSKKNTYTKLSQELEKLRNKSIFKQPKKEILIAEPNKINVEVNNEIQETEYLIEKLKERNKEDRETIEKLNAELIIVQSKMRSLQIRFYNNANLIYDNDENSGENEVKYKCNSARNLSDD